MQQLKIEIPANRRFLLSVYSILHLTRSQSRYDLLCIEGISRALRIFLGKNQAPRYKVVLPQGGESDIVSVTCSPDVRSVFPLSAVNHSKPARLLKLGLTLRVLFYGTSNSPLDHTRRS